MDRICLVLTMLIVALQGAPGVSVGTEQSSTPPADQSARHILWRALGPEGTKVFLLGSIHALPQEAYPLPEAVEAAFDASRVVVLEVDLTDVDEIGGRLFAAGALESGQQLAEVLSPPTRELLESHLETAGLSTGVFNAMKPWMAALSLTTLELMKAGYSPEAGLDLHFARRAARAGKKVDAFESAEFQIGLFADMSEQESEAFLRYTLNDLETVVPQLAEITRAWREGDVEALVGLLTEAFETEPELFDRLVTKRNAMWMPKVEALLAGRDDVLVVVGALHLVGPTGIVGQLRAAGYPVEQY